LSTSSYIAGVKTTWRLSPWRLASYMATVGVLEELGAVLARPFPDHDSDARVLFDLGPSEENGAATTPRRRSATSSA